MTRFMVFARTRGARSEAADAKSPENLVDRKRYFQFGQQFFVAEFLHGENSPWL